MHDSFLIRLAGVQDAGNIADFSRQTFYESFAMYNTKEDMEMFMEEQFSREKLMEEVKDPSNIFLLAFAGEQLAGYSKMKNVQSEDAPPGKNSIEIARIYARQDIIGKGVGSILMKKCLETATSLGKDSIWLGVWEHNQRAIDFYTRWGFEKYSTHPFVLGKDVQTDWLMARSVSRQSPPDRVIRAG